MITEVEFTKILLDKYGQLVSGDDLVKSLGYKTSDAFRQSNHQGTLPIPVFKIKNRRGYYASVKDLAEWLLSQR